MQRTWSEKNNRLWRLVAAVLAAVVLAPTGTQADDWPQWLGPKRDGVWREAGLVEKFPEKGLPVRWRTPVGAGYAGPAVAGNHVYVTDRILTGGSKAPQNGFAPSVTEGKERVLCLDDATGKVVWMHEYDCRYEKISYPSGPRTTPVVHDGKVYTLGTMGDLYCLDADKGKVIWSKSFPRDYKAKVPLWGFAGNPLLDGDKLICLVGGDASAVVALDKDTGKELWRSVSAVEPGYCPPMIFEVGGKRQLIMWLPQSINSLDPETGKVYWSQPFAVKSELTIPTPQMAGNFLFVTSFYNGSMMLKLDPALPAPELVWKGKSKSEQPRLTDGLHSIMTTPYIKDGYIYGVCSYGELRCLKADTGERVWMDLKATGSQEGPNDRWNNLFLTPQADRFFLFSEKGDLIIARLSPKGYEEVSRTHLLEPDNVMAGRPVVWSHPAYAHRSIYVRNDHEIVCASLAAANGKGQ
jgi:outer membrane protein assembly factor BamB